MIDLSALTTAIYVRLATDSQGATVRAVLGSGAASVLMAEDVARLGDGAALRDLCPCVALRRMPVFVADRTEYRVIYRWYCYDDPAAGYARLEALPRLIADAYIDLTDGANLLEIETQAGMQERDRALGLLLQTVDIVVSAV